MQEKELQAKLACEIALFILRKAVRNGEISPAVFEKAAKGFVNDAM